MTRLALFIASLLLAPLALLVIGVMLAIAGFDPEEQR